MFACPVPTIGRAGGIPLWDPSALGANLLRWFDADDAATVISSGGAVSQLSDKSGNGRHATQSTASKQPTYSASARNSKGGIVFDGNLKALTFVGSGLPVTATSAVTLFTVGFTSAYTQGGTGRSSFGYGDVSTSGANRTLGVNGSSPYAVNFSAGNGATTFSSSKSWSGVDKIVCIEIQNAAVTATVDGMTQTGSITTALSSTGGISTGYVGSLSIPWIGTVQGAFIADRLLTQTERDKISGWAAWKYNLVSLLPSGHPYKSAPPTP